MPNKCIFYPCHKGLDDFRCEFCYCPEYDNNPCSGTPVFIKTKTKTIKDCSECTLPHTPEYVKQNYKGDWNGKIICTETR